MAKIKIKFNRTTNYSSINLTLIKFARLIILMSLLISSILSMAQDTEPRRWTNLPLGVKVVGVGYGYTFGNILFDPVLETEDVTITAHTLVASYVQPFRLGKKFARLDVFIPFSNARWEGLLQGEPTSIVRTGLLDPRIRLSYHVLGPKALDPQQLKEYLKEHRVYTTLGVSLAISVPLGQYSEEKLINLGINQFVFRPQIGVAHNWGSWSIELDLSAYIYTKNYNFFNDGSKDQNPLFASQAHLVKRFNSGLWASIGTAYGLGGASRVNRLSKDDERANLLSSAAIGLPIGKLQSAKLAYIHTQTLTDIGSNTNNLVLAWSIVFP